MVRKGRMKDSSGKIALARYVGLAGGDTNLSPQALARGDGCAELFEIQVEEGNVQQEK